MTRCSSSDARKRHGSLPPNLFAAPLTLLYGASGVGKSSVLRAGVINHLRPRDDLLVVEFHAWQSDPLGDLKTAIAKAAAFTDGRGIPPAAAVSLAEYLAAYAVQLDRHLMVILDQFEEYFLYHAQDDAFADQFPNAVMQADAPVSFLISIREDSLAKLDRFEGRIPLLFDNYLRIEHLDREAARTAIEEPIQQYNRLRAADGQKVSIESKLVEAVLDQVKTGQVILGAAGRGVVKGQATEAQIETPYLQLVMTRLWDEEVRLGSSTLRLETLQLLGGAEAHRENASGRRHACPAAERAGRGSTCFSLSGDTVRHQDRPYPPRLGRIC